jgi:Cu(I)/Ag(I) efflux system protein CusF
VLIWSEVAITHGPLQNREIPSTTMVFRVKDPAMLELTKEDDKIKFVADKVSGAFTVTRIEVVS